MADNVFGGKECTKSTGRRISRSTINDPPIEAIGKLLCRRQDEREATTTSEREPVDQSEAALWRTEGEEARRDEEEVRILSQV